MFFKNIKNLNRKLCHYMLTTSNGQTCAIFIGSRIFKLNIDKQLFYI